MTFFFPPEGERSTITKAEPAQPLAGFQANQSQERQQDRQDTENPPPCSENMMVPTDEETTSMSSSPHHLREDWRTTVDLWTSFLDFWTSSLGLGLLGHVP